MTEDYLDIARRIAAEQARTTSTKVSTAVEAPGPKPSAGRYARAFQELEARCPSHIDSKDWRQTVEDGRRFLGTWGSQAEKLGWSSADLFGLAEVPERPAVNYRRLSRYDRTGLCWLLQGNPVVGLTETGATIRMPGGNTTTYYRQNRPALGPLGDTLDDFTK